MGLPGKPNGISGAEVEKYYRDGQYRVWLRHELFRGRMSWLYDIHG
jgi:hypothetical protein